MINNDFTYSFYKKLIGSIISNGYHISSYFDDHDGRVCILRHDVDFDIDKALIMARIEREFGVVSTYFVLLKTDFYNPFSKKNVEALKEIISLGHQIGLHFDEKSYPTDCGDITNHIIEEAKILGEAIDYEIKVVSMHRPSKKTLESNYNIDGIVNSYSNYFFKEYKYVSDSRRLWKENVLEVIKTKKYDKLHILTHPFWYNVTNQSIKDSLSSFINEGKLHRFVGLKENISRFEEIYEMWEEK